MTIDELDKDCRRSSAAMSNPESIGEKRIDDSFEHSPLLHRRRSPKSGTPTRRNQVDTNRWTISELAMHRENMTESDVLKTGATGDFFTSRNRSQDHEDADAMRVCEDSSPVLYRRGRERTRSASLPFLMSNLQLPQIQPRVDTSALRVVVLGESNVGKTSLVHQFLSCVDNEWPDNDNFIADENETYCKSISVDDHHVNLEIVDTPPYSSEEFEEKEDQYFGGGDAFLLVYSVTNRRSFRKANELRFKLQRTKESETVPIVLVGNKNDLERSREVAFEEGKHFAALFDCKLMETSTTIGHNIDELFHGVVRQVRLRKEKQIEDSENMSGGSDESAGSSPSRRKGHYSKKGRRTSTVLNRAKGILERMWRLRGDEPIPGYRARSKSCHVMEVL